jgi:hypothetical protein
LDTQVDRARMAADILPIVADVIRSTGDSMGLSQLGFTSVADADAVELGRPYGVFTIHRGPWLEFMGHWRVPVLVDGTYRSIVEIGRGSSGYTFIGLGAKEFAALLASREQVPALSTALDLGRAGLLRIVTTYGEQYIGYEVPSGLDPVGTEIRVQSLSWYPSVVPGVDGAAMPPELSLAEVNQQLPAE